MPEHCQILISAPSREEANNISDALVREKLVAGALLYVGPARYWWEGEIVEREYWNIQAFSLMKNKAKIISVIEGISSDECPVIAFYKIDGKQNFLKWIEESVE